MDTHTKMGLTWGGTLKASAIGFQHITLKKTGEHYIIGRPETTVNNLMIGTMYIEHVGEMTVKNCKTGMVCPVQFSAAGWGDRGKHEILGKVHKNADDVKNVMGEMKGKWSDKITYKSGG
jgi:hypothetical protein